MRIYKTRADFTKLQAAQNPSIFAGTICTITDEALNPMYVFQGGVWNSTVTATTNPRTGGIGKLSGQPFRKNIDGAYVGQTGMRPPAYLKSAIFSHGSKLLPTSSSVLTTVATPGGAVGTAVSTSVKFNGNPTFKMQVTVGSTGNYIECGVAAATLTIPAQAQRGVTTGYIVAVKPPAGVVLNQSATGMCELYLGDATYANFAKFIALASNQRYVIDANGWWLIHCDPLDAGAKVVTGTEVNYTAALRAKLRFYTTNVGEPLGDWYVGGIWAAPAANVPTVVLTLDDGFAEWHSFVFPEAKKRGIPVSMSVGCGLIGSSATYMTSAQVKEIIDDDSGLFSIHNHARDDNSYGMRGLAGYLSDLDACDAFLSGLGCPSVWRKIHPYVQGSFDATLIAAMKDRGYLSARVVGAQTGNTAHAVGAALLTDDLYQLPASASLDNANTVATVTGYIETAKARNSPVFFIKGHQFLSSQASLAWINRYDDSYGFLNLLDYLADQRDAGNINLVTWGDWVENIYYGERSA